MTTEMFNIIEILGLLLLLGANYLISTRFKRFLLSYIHQHQGNWFNVILVTGLLFGWLFLAFVAGGLYAFVFWLAKGA